MRRQGDINDYDLARRRVVACCLGGSSTCLRHERCAARALGGAFRELVEHLEPVVRVPGRRPPLFVSRRAEDLSATRSGAGSSRQLRDTSTGRPRARAAACAALRACATTSSSTGCYRGRPRDLGASTSASRDEDGERRVPSSTSRRGRAGQARASLPLPRHAGLDADGILVVDRADRRYNRKFVEMWNIPESVSPPVTTRRCYVSTSSSTRSVRRKVRDLYDEPDAESFDVIEFNGRGSSVLEAAEDLREAVAVWSFRDGRSASGRRRRCASRSARSARRWRTSTSSRSRWTRPERHVLQRLPPSSGLDGGAIGRPGSRARSPRGRAGPSGFRRALQGTLRATTSRATTRTATCADLWNVTRSRRQGRPAVIGEDITEARAPRRRCARARSVPLADRERLESSRSSTGGVSYASPSIERSRLAGGARRRRWRLLDVDDVVTALAARCARRRRGARGARAGADGGGDAEAVGVRRRARAARSS